MSVYVERLKDAVIHKASEGDEIIIISGYFSADMLEEIAKLGLQTDFYYGMYGKSGITELQAKALGNLETKYPNFSAKIVFDYHVHTKCYIFKRGGTSFEAMVGSANVSNSGLACGKNSELLMSIKDSMHLALLDTYAKEVDSASVRFNDPLIIPSLRGKVPSRTVLTTNGRVYSGNPFVDNIPLYLYEGGKKVVPGSSGLNWGLQKGHVKKASSFAEAYIPIKAFDIDNYPLIIPALGTVGSGVGGKSTRRLGPVTVTWDDGEVMKMLFQGNGPTRPTPAKRAPGSPYREYPKQLTTDEGGAALGEYLRKRLGVGGRAVITYKDLKSYGRDYITLTLVGADDYEADFQPLK